MIFRQTFCIFGLAKFLNDGKQMFGLKKITLPWIYHAYLYVSTYIDVYQSSLPAISSVQNFHSQFIHS